MAFFHCGVGGGFMSRYANAYGYLSGKVESLIKAHGLGVLTQVELVSKLAEALSWSQKVVENEEE